MIVVQFTSIPSMDHCHTIERVSRILKRAINLILHYQKNCVALKGYNDANWSNLIDDYNTTNNYIFIKVGEMFPGKSKK